MFLCLQNSLGAVLYLMDVAPSFRNVAGPVPLLATLTTIGTAVAAVLSDIDMTVQLWPLCSIPLVHEMPCSPSLVSDFQGQSLQCFGRFS